MSSVEVQRLYSLQLDLGMQLERAVGDRRAALDAMRQAADAEREATERMFRLRGELSRVEDELVEAVRVAAG